MARFQVYAIQGEGALALDVQADIFDDLKTRIVVPLVPMTALKNPFERLNPVFRINDQNYMMRTQSIASVPSSELGLPVVDLSGEHDKITAALDYVFQGF